MIDQPAAGQQKRPVCPHVTPLGEPCIFNRRHIGACETEPKQDCKHGFMWYAMGPRERPYTVDENAAYYGIQLSTTP